MDNQQSIAGKRLERLVTAAQRRMSDPLASHRIHRGLRKSPRWLTAGQFRKEYVERFGRQLIEPGVDVEEFYDWVKRASPDAKSRVAVAEFILELLKEQKCLGVAVPEFCTLTNEVRVMAVEEALLVLYAHDRMTHDVVVLDVWRETLDG